MSQRVGRIAGAVLVVLWASSIAQGADLGARHRIRRHHHRVAAEPIVVPPGYAYGGYGNGPGPGWQDPGPGPGYGYGFSPGIGYVPADGPYTGFDVAY